MSRTDKSRKTLMIVVGRWESGVIANGDGLFWGGADANILELDTSGL